MLIRVAEIFLATSPDFPMPVRMTLPLAFRIIWMARSNSGPDPFHQVQDGLRLYLQNLFDLFNHRVAHSKDPQPSLLTFSENLLKGLVR